MKRGVGNKAVVIFNKLDVLNIDTNSGIFIGNNVANGWSTFLKLNYGFGLSGDHSVVSDNMSMVIDNDLVDAPMSNHSVMLDRRQFERNHTFVHLHSIDVNKMDSNSSVSVGETNVNEWGSFGKSNYGNGKFTGSTILPNNRCVVNDSDAIDNPVEDSSHLRLGSSKSPA